MTDGVQEVERVVDPVGVFPDDAELASVLGACCEHDVLVALVSKVLQRNVLADADTALDVDAGGFDPVDVLEDGSFGQPVAGNDRGGHAAPLPASLRRRSPNRRRGPGSRRPRDRRGPAPTTATRTPRLVEGSARVLGVASDTACRLIARMARGDS